MENTKRKLWSGAVLIEQDNLPGLSQGEEVNVEIFHEEASKRKCENFDWTSSSKKIAKFLRFPKWSLKSKSPGANLLPYIKDSYIVKLSLPNSEVPSKFASLVESLAKCGKESFCGYLRPEEDNLRPVCLMLTERGLLGFCVDVPLQEDKEDSTSLFAKFEKTLKENFMAGDGKCKVKVEVVEVKVETEKDESTGSENVQLNIRDKPNIILGEGSSVLRDDGLKVKEIELGNGSTTDVQKDSYHSQEGRETMCEENLVCEDEISTLNAKTSSDDNNALLSKKAENISELGLTTTVAAVEETVSGTTSTSDHILKLKDITELQSISTSSVKEDAIAIARNVLSKHSVHSNQEVKESNNLEAEIDFELPNKTCTVAAFKEIADCASNEVNLKIENLERLNKFSRSDVQSTSFTPSLREKALAIARNVLFQTPVQKSCNQEDRDVFQKADDGESVTKNLQVDDFVNPVFSKSPNPSSSYPTFELSDSALPSFEVEPEQTIPHFESFIVDGKDPNALKIYSTSNENGTEVLHPIFDHNYASSVIVPHQVESKESKSRNLTDQAPPCLTPSRRAKQNTVKKIDVKGRRTSFDQERADKMKDYFTRKFSTLGLSRMKEIKVLYLKFINKDLSSAEFVKKAKLTESSQVKTATLYLEEEFPHLREAILIGTVKLSDLHWIFNDTSVVHNRLKIHGVWGGLVHNRVVSSPVVDKKEKGGPKLSKLDRPGHLSTTITIPLEYEGHSEWTVQVRSDIREYMAIFSEHHILFCNKSTRLPQKLVQSYLMKNKVWNGETEGKIYLPDMFFPTKLNEVHFFVIQDSQSFEEKFLNLGNLQESTSLITKENFLKFILAHNDKTPGISMSWKLINPTDEEGSVLSKSISLFLREVNAITSYPHETIDLFHDRIERLIDVPGIDDEVALQIYKARTQSKTLLNFIQKDYFGFEVLTEFVQHDVGLLARQDLTLCYNGLAIGSWYLKILEQNVFQQRFFEWRRPTDVPCIIMVAVLGFLSSNYKQTGKAIELKYRINNLESSEENLEKSWVKFGLMVLSFMEGSKMFQTYDMTATRNAEKLVVSSPQIIGKDFKILTSAPKVNSYQLLSSSKVVKVTKKQADEKKEAAPNLLADLSVSTSNNNNYFIEKNDCCVTKTKVKPPENPTKPKQNVSSHVKSSSGFVIFSSMGNPTTQRVNSTSSADSEKGIKSVNFSAVSPVKLARKQTVFSNTPSSVKYASGPLPDIVKTSILPCSEKQSAVAASADSTSKTSSSRMPASLSTVGNKSKSEIDKKLFLRTSVKLNKMNSNEISHHLRNNVTSFEEVSGDIVTLEEAFDNFQLYAEPMADPVESLLPSLESQLERLNKSKEYKKAMVECSLCKKMFSSHEARHQHYLSGHDGFGKAEKLTEKQFECSLCEKAFVDRQGRHEHYVDVHCT